MKKYSFAYNSDKKLEAIDTKEFESLELATLYFAGVKKLDMDFFLKMYKVFETNGKQTASK
jgi:hypothetical protein